MNTSSRQDECRRTRHWTILCLLVFLGIPNTIKAQPILNHPPLPDNVTVVFGNDTRLFIHPPGPPHPPCEEVGPHPPHHNCPPPPPQPPLPPQLSNATANHPESSAIVPPKAKTASLESSSSTASTIY